MKTLLIAFTALYLVGCSVLDKAPKYIAPSTNETELKIGKVADSVKRASEANSQSAEAITKAHVLSLSLRQKLELLKRGEVK
jgi:hypothetical protein